MARSKCYICNPQYEPHIHIHAIAQPRRIKQPNSSSICLLVILGEHHLKLFECFSSRISHLGLLKAKLARYRQQLLEPTSKGGKPGEGFDVQKSGGTFHSIPSVAHIHNSFMSFIDARVALIGFPSVGKSTFLSKMTNTTSEVAAYEFTTLTAIPVRLICTILCYVQLTNLTIQGVLEYQGARIQLLDLPVSGSFPRSRLYMLLRLNPLGNRRRC